MGTLIHCWDNSLSVPQRIKYIVTIWSHKSMPVNIFQRNENIYHKETCTTMFIIALFRIEKHVHQPKCSSMGECIKKKTCGGILLAIKRNDVLLLHATT